MSHAACHRGAFCAAVNCLSHTLPCQNTILASDAAAVVAVAADVAADIAAAITVALAAAVVAAFAAAGWVQS